MLETSSIMGDIETSLSHGPLYFNVYPNLTLSLSDRNIGETVNLRMLTKGYNFLSKSKTVTVIYRIYYKIMNMLTPNVKNITTTIGYTTLIESNMLNKFFSATIRLNKWEDIEFSNN